MSLFRLKMEDPSSAHEKAIVYARCGGLHQMVHIRFSEYQWEQHVSLRYKYLLKIYDGYMQLTADGLYCSDLNNTTSFGMCPLFANRTYHMPNRCCALYNHQRLHRWWFPDEDPPELPQIVYV